jgi:hypothetical protein
VFLAVGFGVVVYAASSWVNKSFSDRERQIINEASGRHWFVF